MGGGEVVREGGGGKMGGAYGWRGGKEKFGEGCKIGWGGGMGGGETKECGGNTNGGIGDDERGRKWRWGGGG